MNMSPDIMIINGQDSQLGRRRSLMQKLPNFNRLGAFSIFIMLDRNFEFRSKIIYYLDVLGYQTYYEMKTNFMNLNWRKLTPPDVIQE